MVRQAVGMGPRELAEYLYRGVAANHPNLKLARQGIVRPGNAMGNVDPKDHNDGGFGHLSRYTSWTRRVDVARVHANLAGLGGLVLRVPTGAPPPGAGWRWELSPDEYKEDEVLLEGERSGLEIFEA